jgi:hypothetical protein
MGKNKLGAKVSNSRNTGLSPIVHTASTCTPVAKKVEQGGTVQRWYGQVQLFVPIETGKRVLRVLPDLGFVFE